MEGGALLGRQMPAVEMKTDAHAIESGPKQIKPLGFLLGAQSMVLFCHHRSRIARNEPHQLRLVVGARLREDVV